MNKKRMFHVQRGGCAATKPSVLLSALWLASVTCPCHAQSVVSGTLSFHKRNILRRASKLDNNNDNYKLATTRKKNTRRRLQQQHQQRSLSNDWDKKRVEIDGFQVTLLPTCQEFTTGQINQLYIAIREAFTDEFYGQVIDLGEGLQLNFVAISNIVTDTDTATCKTLLTIGESFVSFQAPGGNAPVKANVNAWAKKAVKEKLNTTLPDTLSFIETILFPGEEEQQKGNEEDKDKEEETNQDQDKDKENHEQQPQDKQDSTEVAAAQDPSITAAAGNSDDNQNGMIFVILCVLATAFTSIGLTMLFVMKKSRCKPIHPYLEYENSKGCDSIQSTESPKQQDDVQTERSPDSEDHRKVLPVVAATLAVQQQQQRKHVPPLTPRLHKQSDSITSDDLSLGGASGSSWTVSTEAGDSMALKSLPSRPSAWASDTSLAGQVWQGLALVSPESFEYDRSLNLRKDMLTSAWSGRMPTQHADKNDSVLQPSHFSASHERERRMQEEAENVAAAAARRQRHSRQPKPQHQPLEKSALTARSSVSRSGVTSTVNHKTMGGLTEDAHVTRPASPGGYVFSLGNGDGGDGDGDSSSLGSGRGDTEVITMVPPRSHSRKMPRDLV